MAITIDTIFGVHEQALQARSRRAQLLAANLANSDTPHYKARDIDFEAALKSAGSGPSGVRVTATHPRHLSGHALLGGGLAPKYRVPSQPSLDDNTVEPHVEQAAFVENALAYQASLAFLDSRIQGLRLAIRGE